MCNKGADVYASGINKRRESVLSDGIVKYYNIADIYIMNMDYSLMLKKKGAKRNLENLPVF